MRFEPSGFTKNSEIPYAKSITDYIFRWLASKFLSAEHQQAVGVQTSEASLKPHSGPVVASGIQVDRAPESGAPVAAMRAQTRRAALPLLRQHHDPQRVVLPLRQLRLDERLQLASLRSGGARVAPLRAPRSLRPSESGSARSPLLASWAAPHPPHPSSAPPE